MAKVTKGGLTEVLNAVTLKTDYRYDKKDLSAFVLALFMSEDPSLQKIVADINPYLFDMPDELIFKYFVNAVPKGRRYMKFTKKSEQSKDRMEKIKELAEERGISKREASLSL